jgi:membrane dipeptidase
VIILDAHQDLAYNAIQYGRDYPSGVTAIRRADARAGEKLIAANGLPEALAGRVAVIFATLFVEPEWASLSPIKRCGYTTPEEAQRQAIRQWDYYQRLVEREPRLRLIDDQAGLDSVLATWEPAAQPDAHQIGLVLLMEGADPILEPACVEEWVARGVRIIGPAWSETRYAGGTGRPGPLTDLGRELLEVMAEYGLILDLSHMTIQG